jgi:hypothetical protein
MGSTSCASRPATSEYTPARSPRPRTNEEGLLSSTSAARRDRDLCAQTHRGRQGYKALSDAPPKLAMAIVLHEIVITHLDVLRHFPRDVVQLHPRGQ